MRTTQEVRMALRSCRKVCIDRFTQTNLLPEGSETYYSSLTWRENQSYQPCLRADSSAQTDQLASEAIYVNIRNQFMLTSEISHLAYPPPAHCFAV
ncbi:hypothetical protein AVEN_234980-1 [Araneus ventricosus]|uniref:Uncharacterized protein n=1 Tax=Araneus ventricosus TaxID=182803 RepID=A0A4Y2FMK1_ARAVE|nr:hypothetical protein AVEN_234980-1 [Araneus ventricosus]